MSEMKTETNMRNYYFEKQDAENMNVLNHIKEINGKSIFDKVTKFVPSKRKKPTSSKSLAGSMFKSNLASSILSSRKSVEKSETGKNNNIIHYQEQINFLKKQNQRLLQEKNAQKVTFEQQMNHLKSIILDLSKKRITQKASMLTQTSLPQIVTSIQDCDSTSAINSQIQSPQVSDALSKYPEFQLVRRQMQELQSMISK